MGSSLTIVKPNGLLLRIIFRNRHLLRVFGSSKASIFLSLIAGLFQETVYGWAFLTGNSRNDPTEMEVQAHFA